MVATAPNLSKSLDINLELDENGSWLDTRVCALHLPHHTPPRTHCHMRTSHG